MTNKEFKENLISKLLSRKEEIPAILWKDEKDDWFPKQIKNFVIDQIIKDIEDIEEIE